MDKMRTKLWSEIRDRLWEASDYYKQAAWLAGKAIDKAEVRGSSMESRIDFTQAAEKALAKIKTAQEKADEVRHIIERPERYGKVNGDGKHETE